MRKDLPVNQKIFDMIVWLTDRLDHFPRARRYTLGKRIEDNLYDLLEHCIDARYTRDQKPKLAYLRKANTRLEKLRYFLRLCHQQKMINSRQYQFASEKIDEIGLALGGWAKEVKQR